MLGRKGGFAINEDEDSDEDEGGEEGGSNPRTTGPASAPFSQAINSIAVHNQSFERWPKLKKKGGALVGHEVACLYPTGADDIDVLKWYVGQVLRFVGGDEHVIKFQQDLIEELLRSRGTCQMAR